MSDLITLEVLAERVDMVIDTLARVEEQTTATNGRVREIEVSRRVEAALAADRASMLAAERALAAQTLATQTTERAQVLAVQANKLDARGIMLNTIVGSAGIMAGIAAALLIH